MNILKDMLDLEIQTAAFYENGTSSFTDAGVKKIFLTLAKQTKSNADTLKKLIETEKISDDGVEQKNDNIFACLDDCGCAMIRAEELATYVAGSDMERKLISQYNKIRSTLSSQNQTQVIDSIIKKHKDALFVLNDMIEMLNRNNDWVESAEFTVREPY